MKQLQAKYEEAIASLNCNAELQKYTINHLTFYAAVAGDRTGKLVVLLHGFPECWYSWRKQIPVLVDAGYYVVAPDLRGYGLNDQPEEMKHYSIRYLADDIKELIKQQNKGKAIVIAHDWGGASAWNFAMWYPEFIDRLIILNAPHPVTFARELRNKQNEQYKKSWYMRFFQKKSWPERLFLNDPLQTAKWFFIEKWGYNTDEYTEEDLSLYATLYRTPNVMEAMLNWYRASYQYRQKDTPAPSKIQIDTLVIWGEQDRSLSIKLLDGLEEWVDSLTIKRIPNAGHFVQNEAPEQVNDIVLKYLSKQYI